MYMYMYVHAYILNTGFVVMHVQQVGVSVYLWHIIDSLTLKLSGYNTITHMYMYAHKGLCYNIPSQCSLERVAVIGKKAVLENTLFCLVEVVCLRRDVLREGGREGGSREDRGREGGREGGKGWKEVGRG